MFDRSIKDNIAYGLDVDLSDTEVIQKVIQVSKSVNLHNFVSSLPQVNYKLDRTTRKKKCKLIDSRLFF